MADTKTIWNYLDKDTFRGFLGSVAVLLSIASVVALFLVLIWGLGQLASFLWTYRPFH